jgi:lipopolysaccharide heptosyltransferase I
MNNPPLDAPQRILIVRQSALGDIIHSLALLDALRKALPNASIGWLCEPAGVQLLEGHPMIDRLHVVPRREWKKNRWQALRSAFPRLRRELKEAGYGVSIDTQGLSKSAVWPWLAGIPVRIGYLGVRSRELSSFFNNRFIEPPRGRCHVIQCCMELLRGLGLDPPSKEKIETHIHITGSDLRRADEILAGKEVFDAPLVVMSLGAGWLTKIWAPEKYAELAIRLVREQGACVVLAWGPGEEYLVRQALEHVRESDPDQTGRSVVGNDVAFKQAVVRCDPGIRVMPDTNFMELSAVISRADLFVGGDTGPTHMAAALKIPTVSMMGPLDARVNGPFGEHCRTIQHAVPAWAPKGDNHRKWCDPATDLKHITVDEIHAACIASLK